MNVIQHFSFTQKTRRSLLLLLMLLSTSFSFAQDNGKVDPLTNMEIEKKVAVIDIEGNKYEDVIVELKSNKPDMVFTTTYKVKIKVTNKTGQNILKKTFKNAFLYIFPGGQIQVGRPNFDQIVITKLPETGEWYGMIREKEGVY